MLFNLVLQIILHPFAFYSKLADNVSETIIDDMTSKCIEAFNFMATTTTTNPTTTTTMATVSAAALQFGPLVHRNVAIAAALYFMVWQNCSAKMLFF